MDKVRIILAFLAIFLLLTIAGITNSTPFGTPGVSVGNNFTYGNVSFEWYSNDPSAIPPAEWSDLNETAWLLGTVDNIVGTNVSISSVIHFINGTEKTEDNWIDVDTGEGNMTMMLISANLNAGDPIYSGSTYSSWTINETIPITYPGGSRETNHMNTAMEMSMPPYYISFSMNMYWDKTTGILTKLYVTSNQTTAYTTYYSVSMELTESNQWIVPEFFGLLTTLLLLAALASFTLVLKRKLNKT